MAACAMRLPLELLNLRWICAQLSCAAVGGPPAAGPKHGLPTICPIGGSGGSMLRWEEEGVSTGLLAVGVELFELPTDAVPVPTADGGNGGEIFCSGGVMRCVSMSPLAVGDGGDTDLRCCCCCCARRASLHTCEGGTGWLEESVHMAGGGGAMIH